MGNYFTVNMEENFRKNQDFITQMNNIKMERQLQMHNQMRERQLALQVANSRELFFWFGAFYMTSWAWAMMAYRYKRRMLVFSPLVPMTFIMAYQTDLAYGSKRSRVKVEAEHIMQFEQDLLSLPLGVPTPSSIDIARMQTDDHKKLHPMLPPV